jgi:hypothetical protein
MAVDTKVEIVGLPRLTATMRAAEADLNELKDATAAALRVVLAASTSTAPRRSGALAGSGRGNRARRRAIITYGSAAVPYAGPIHWGWPRRHLAGQPWVSRAAQATEPVWVAAYAAELERIIDQVHGV